MLTRLVVAGVLGSLVLAGCSGPPEPPRTTLSASSFIGKPLGDAYRAVGYDPPTTMSPDLGVTSYNMAPILTRTPPGGQAQPTWTVIASCFTDAPVPGGPDTPAPRLILGAVPAETVTPQVQAQADRRTYDGRLNECRSGARDIFTVTEPAAG